MEPISSIRIRQATHADLSAITQLYNGLIEHAPTTAQLDTVTLENRQAWYVAQDRQRHPVYIAQEGGTLLGYISLTPYRQGRRALDGAAEVSYFVRQDKHGRGIGSKLVAHVLERSTALHIHTLLAILLETNTASIALLKKFGFQQWGVLPGIATIQNTAVSQVYFGLSLPLLEAKQ